MFARGSGGLRYWADWLPAFGRRRLWCSNEAALGHEFPKRRRTDSRESSSDSDLRISDLDVNCRNSVAGRTKSTEWRGGGESFLLLFDFDRRRSVPDRVHPY